MTMTRSLLCIAAVLALASVASPARAEKISTEYRLVDLGRNVQGAAGLTIGIDEDGNPVLPSIGSRGDYSSGWITDPDTPNVPIEVYVRKAGSDANLLPDWMSDPYRTSIKNLNTSGQVVGQYGPGGDGSFYYETETGLLVDLKPVPGLGGSVDVFGLNNTGQIVGTQGNSAILYTDPTAVPVELTSLLQAGTDWRLWRATGINDRGEIVGFGINDGGPLPQSGFYKLEPLAVPEPTPLAILAAVGVLAAVGRAARRPRVRGDITS